MQRLGERHQRSGSDVFDGRIRDERGDGLFRELDGALSADRRSNDVLELLHAVRAQRVHRRHGQHGQLALRGLLETRDEKPFFRQHE